MGAYRLGRAGGDAHAGRHDDDFPTAFTAAGHPVDVRAAGRDVGGNDVRGLAAKRSNVHHDVINISGVVAGRRLRGLDGNVTARAGVLGERELVVGIRVGSGGHGTHRHKRRNVRGIGHNTHHHIEGVAGVVAGIEGELQRVHREGVHVNLRQDGDLVAVSAGRGVSVETHGVVAGSGIRRAGIDDRVPNQ